MRNDEKKDWSRGLRRMKQTKIVPRLRRNRCGIIFGSFSLGNFVNYLRMRCTAHNPPVLRSSTPFEKMLRPQADLSSGVKGSCRRLRILPALRPTPFKLILRRRTPSPATVVIAGCHSVPQHTMVFSLFCPYVHLLRHLYSVRRTVLHLRCLGRAT